MSKENFLFIGGDLRQIYAAKNLFEKGYEVSFFGFENFEKMPKEFLSFGNLKIAVILSDVIVLPTPLIKNGVLNMPFSEQKVRFEDFRNYLNEEKLIFGGKIDGSIKSYLNKNSLKFYDFLEEEEINLQNSYLTSQGAVGKILNFYGESLNSKKILITGFGKIAKSLIEMLSAFKPNITVGARKSIDLTAAGLLGCKGKFISEIDCFDEYDMIINTVPVKLFSNNLLQSCKVPFIELANFENISNENYHIFPSIPGKMFPVSSGELFAHFIIGKLTEVNNE